MDYNKYKNTLPYPEKPTKPKEPKLTGKDSDAYRAHADAMDQYAKDLKAYEAGPLAQYNEQRDAYHKEGHRLEEEFKKDLLEELGVTGHPKAEKLYSLCYMKNHSGGFSDVASIAHDFVELLSYNMVELDELNKWMEHKRYN